MWCLGRVLQYILTWIEPGFVNTQISAFNSGKSCLELEELQNKNISADGIHFLDMLLSNEPAQRPEPAEALEDPWICRDLNEAHIALQSARINVEKRNIDTIRWIIDHGNKDMIRLVLDYDMDIDNIPIGDGSPLHYAVTVGNLDAVKYFVELGADLEKRTEPSLSETALHLAVRHGQVQILEYLIQRGANLEALSGSDKTPIASFEKDISKDCIQVLLERKVKFEAKSDVSFDERSVIYPEWIPGATIRKGFTPLHRAAFLGLHDITKLLLEWHADVKAQTQTGETAAHVACENGHVEIVKMLLEFGDILEAKDIYGNTALAVYRDDALPAVEFLLDQGANIEASNDEKFTPLHHASLHRCVGVARLFLHRGADVDPKSEWSSTPLHLATASGASQVVMLLLEHGANVETLDGDGHTPLGCTLEPSSMCVELLLAKGANMYAAQNSRKLSPLHVAVRSNNFKVVELILTKARRNLYESQEKLKRTKSEANQNRAYQNAKKEYEKSKEEFEKIVNGKSKSRKTPLDYATTYKPIDVRIATLLKYHGGTTSIQLVWERSMQRVYESWRICEHCRCTIFGTGWQCDLCSPEARNRHDTRNTYDVCSICAVQGKRCNGEGHYLYLKPPTGPVDRSVSVSPLENGSSRYEASISSIGTQLSTQSEDSFPLYFNPGGDGPSGNGSMQTTLEKSITIRHNHDPQSRITPDHPRVPRGTSRPLLHRNRDSISSLASASSGGSTPLESPTAAGSTNIPFFHEINLPSRDADADPTRRRTSAPSPLLFRVRE